MPNAVAAPMPSQPQIRAANPTLNALRVRAGAQTHVGNVRQNNEDQFLIGDVTSAIQVRKASLCESNHLYLGTSPMCLLIVADGMGGHAAGERAAALAVTSVESFILRALGHIGTLGIRGPADLLQASFQAADGTVIEAAERNDSLAGMGTTMTVAMIGGSEAHIAHAGDSRAYLLRERALRRLTRDHTVAEALREGGLVKNPELHPLHHVITNAVGGGTAGVNPDIARVDLSPGDRLLLCTDGLTNMLDDEKIAEILSSELKPAEVSQHLVEAALAAGGDDNVTVVVAFLDAA
ncbi:MAG: PP2C family protein-serine/threonine phosphatase, partial [Myxococcales bacterium]